MAAMSEERPVRPAGNAAPEAAVRYTVLVVDDDEALQFYVRKTLEGHYEVLQALTALQAVNYLESSSVDLVLLDLILPDAQGASLCRQIKERWPERGLSIIVLTAKSDLESKVEVLEAGADDYITKPFHEKELLTRIKVQLRVKGLQREMIKTERLKAMIATAISANHEINNPLCAIINSAELMMKLPSITRDAEATKYLERIFRSALRIEETIQKMSNIIQPAISEYLPGIPMLDIRRSEAKDKG